MNTPSDVGSVDRGRDAVRGALIKASCELLAEVGPNAMSVRKVALRAGVNHGQIHHYFGGKQGLIEAAIAHLAREHFEHAHERAGTGRFPPPLTLSEDSTYLRAMVRLALDGHISAAIRELSEEYSIPREFQEYVTREFEPGAVPVDIRARLAATFALELGWAALEPVVLKMADVPDDQTDAVRERARVLARSFLNGIDALD